MSERVSCLVCREPVTTAATLTADRLRVALGEYFAETLPPDVHLDSYELLRCGHCELEFAWPLTAGDGAFYGWVASHPSYYPRQRAEWRIVLDELTRSGGKSVLEVGSGWGHFLEYAGALGLQATGVDTTESSVQACRSRGLDVHCTMLEDYSRLRPGERFDAVVAFHCLEHVPDPVGLIRDMRALLSPTGHVYVSVPHSPLSSEVCWFDPLNHPPHHLTRWNVKSLDYLLRSCGAIDVRISEHEQGPVLRRTLDSLNWKLNTYGRGRPRYQLWAQLMLRPHELLRALRHQTARGRGRGDMLLARAR